MKFNGKIISLKDNTLLTDFLKNNNYEIPKIAVELNGKIIPKTQFENTAVCDCDTIEVVSFVGGG